MKGTQPLPIRLHILPLGPGMSLVLQTSQGFLQSGVGGPWEVLYRPLIKTICVCVNATMTVFAQFFRAGKEGGEGLGNAEQNDQREGSIPTPAGH